MDERAIKDKMNEYYALFFESMKKGNKKEMKKYAELYNIEKAKLKDF